MSYSSIKKFVWSITLTCSLCLTTPAAILYFDAPSLDGSTPPPSSPTVVWQQWNGTNAWEAFDLVTAQTDTSAGWNHRTSGGSPANAFDGTAFNRDNSIDAEQVRVVFSGLNAADSHEFFLFNTAAGGSAAALAKIDTNTTLTTEYTGLSEYNSADDSVGGTAINVLADGTPGTAGSNDERYRHSLGSFTGSTSYAFVIDDFGTGTPTGGGSRAALDGVGIETTVIPEPSSFAMLCLGLGAFLILRMRRR